MEKQKVIFFTGAGISVDSGIPTFQEQPGIRDKLTRDFANEHPEEWTNTTITDFLGQLASWVDDISQFDKETDWDNVDYKTFAKMLYMGKIYE